MSKTNNDNKSKNSNNQLKFPTIYQNKKYKYAIPLFHFKDKHQKYLGSHYHIENMPVAVPNSSFELTDSFEKNQKLKYCSSNLGMMDSYYNNKFNINERKLELPDLKNNYEEYINRLEQRNKRLENINDIFLNMLREQKYSLMRNHSCENINYGGYPYLSYEKDGNKRLLYLDKEYINNNKLISGNYKGNYLVPLFPKNNSISDNNKILYLLNNEKLKYLRNDLPNNNLNNYDHYKNNINNNIPQKINSVQYSNDHISYKKFSSKENNFNMDNKKIENNNDLINEIKKMNDNLNDRLKKIENSQSIQKRDIEYLMSKTKNSKEPKLKLSNIKSEKSLNLSNNAEKKKENEINKKGTKS